nr:immunoglobulin heavy chain junction region [Macaca mulatta]MOX94512.1 immunoglobulin heavy chain junction region [Macaca mulatta]MOX96147.1 immunoglobulin heavy chain junction region [Macaca mulatta]
CTGRYGGLDYW